VGTGRGDRGLSYLDRSARAVGVWEIRSSGSGSGGLGAVSADLSEAIVGVGTIAFVIVFVWRLRRTRRVT
jgi:hypothetical protein